MPRLAVLVVLLALSYLEVAPQLTVTNSCQNGGTYLQSSNSCDCLVGYTGTSCETEVKYCTANTTCPRNSFCMEGIGRYTCDCIDRYTGSSCQTDRCPSETWNITSCPAAGCDCGPNGVCTDGGVCHCSIGFTGNRCENARGHILPPNNSDLAFGPLTLQAGSTLVCHTKLNGAFRLAWPCGVSVFLTTKSRVAPNVKMHFSPELAINSTMKPVRLTTDVAGVTVMFETTIIIKGYVTSTENHYVCIIASQGNSQIERCFNMKFTPDPWLDPTTSQYAQRNAVNRFIDPTPHDDSVLICTERYTCVFLLYTHSSNHNLPCPGLPGLITTSKDVLVFKTHQENRLRPCVTEIAVLPNNNTDRTICFATGLEDYQQRCLRLKFYPQNADPCAKAPCYNNGICIRTGQDSFKCACPANYEGDVCQKGMGVSLTCNVENTCQWMQSELDDMDWNVMKGPTQSSETGPNNDHTLGNENGAYFYIESSSPSEIGDTATLISPYLSANISRCLGFWYSMYGDGIGNLTVTIQALGKKTTTLLSMYGDKGPRWQKSTTTIPEIPNGYQIVITGSVGPTYRGDMALDDIQVKPGKCQGVGIGEPQLIG